MQPGADSGASIGEAEARLVVDEPSAGEPDVEAIPGAARTPVVEAAVIDRKLLVRYRVLAFSTATLLIILVFVGLPLQFAAGRPAVVNDVGTVHGFLYIAYLFVAFQLTRRLKIPKWQMGLVLLAGTVPFCAFVAERKLTRRFEAAQTAAGDVPGTAAGAVPGTAPAAPPAAGSSRAAGTGFASRVRRRWFSRRALLLHLEVAILAPACAAAGWWQATRALGGNGLSWVYSIEWPVFSLLAIAGWWYLIHEDPEVYRARRQRPADDEGHLAPGPAGGLLGRERAFTVGVTTGRLATVLAALAVLEVVVGVVVLIVVPIGRPSGVLPTRSASVYLAHAILGIPLVVGSVLFLLRVRSAPRLSRLSGRIGMVGVAAASLGGLLTASHPLRFAGMVLMLLGAVVAVFGYVIPTLEKL